MRNKCQYPKKEIIETFRKISNNTDECKKCSKQTTRCNNLKCHEKVCKKNISTSLSHISHITMRIIFENMNKIVKMSTFHLVLTKVNETDDFIPSFF